MFDIKEGRKLTLDGETVTISEARETWWEGRMKGGRYDGERFDIRSWEVEFEDAPGEYILFLDAEAAGKAARIYWQDKAENDPEEFRAIVGDKALIAWALGQPASPGAATVGNLAEWLDLWLDVPEEAWARYDGNECEAEYHRPGKPVVCVAYRTN